MSLERLEKIQNAFRVVLYGTTKEESLAAGKCLRCKLPVMSGINVFSPAGAAEYEISGLCETCFDEITKVEEDEPVNVIDALQLGDEPYTGTVQKDHAAYARQWLIDNGFDKDFEVVVADDFQLMLDYDQKEIPQKFYVILDILEKALIANVNTSVSVAYEESSSKSGNVHIIINLPYPMGIFERIAWQACFGSDPKNAALQLLSIAKNEANPVLLYNRKKTLALPPAPEPLLLGE